MDHYSRQEVAYLVGPVMRIDPDNIRDVVILVITHDDNLRIKGPEHTPEILGNVFATCFGLQWKTGEDLHDEHE